MRNRSIPNKEELNKYYSLGYSMNEIAQYLGYSTGKIHKYFHIYNIKPRNWGSRNEFAKKKISKTMTGRTHKGKPMSEENKKNISEMRCLKGIGHKKIRNDGYIAIYFPDHPKSNKDGYIMEHDLIMECYIGRWLKDDEVVHHKNHIRNDNRIKNLELLTKKEHARLHMIERHNKKREEWWLINKICVIGRITKDIELKETESNIKYTRFSIAVNRNYKNEDGEYEADFFNIIAWRKTAEIINDYFKKGSRIAISGKLQTNKYTDKDGNERTSVEIVADDIDFIDKKEEPKEEVKEEKEDPMSDEAFAEFGDSIEINDEEIAF